MLNILRGVAQHLRWTDDAARRTPDRRLPFPILSAMQTGPHLWLTWWDTSCSPKTSVPSPFLLDLSSTPLDMRHAPVIGGGKVLPPWLGRGTLGGNVAKSGNLIVAFRPEQRVQGWRQVLAIN